VSPLLKVESILEGRALELCLDAPPANVINAAMIAEMREALDRAVSDPSLAAVHLSHSGKHFSFGASVEEHLPGQFEGMIKGFHALCLKLAELPVPLVASVGGQCLGGGLELVLFSTQLFLGPKAKLAQPEIQLGVFAPVASCLLPARMGSAQAESFLLSGRSVGSEEALRLGLAQAVAEDPAASAREWIETQLVPHSAFALRQALAAARAGWLPSFRAQLAQVESRYLKELMAGADPEEGLRAFVEKRSPSWRHQ